MRILVLAVVLAGCANNNPYGGGGFGSYGGGYGYGGYPYTPNYERYPNYDRHYPAHHFQRQAQPAPRPPPPPPPPPVRQPTPQEGKRMLEQLGIH